MKREMAIARLYAAFCCGSLITVVRDPVSGALFRLICTDWKQAAFWRDTIVGGIVRAQTREEIAPHEGRRVLMEAGAFDTWLKAQMRRRSQPAKGGDLDLAPGPMDIEEDEQIGGPVALVLAIVALKRTRPGRDRRPHLADELDRALVEADHWAVRIRRFGIEVEHVLHAGDVFGVDLRNAPHVLRQGFKSFSVKRRRTVSREMLVCSVRRTSSPAKSSSVQRARPAGGLEQAVATSSACSLPDSFRFAPGRGSSLSAAF